MGKIAFVFSGQGAQYPGMGQSLYNSFESVRELYDAAEKIRPGITETSFNGSEEELRITSTTQPCIYLASLGAAIALSEKGVTPTALAGFSLGEITALAFGGAYGYIKGFGIVCERGLAMQRAAESSEPAAMCAVLKLPEDTVKELCSEFQGLYPVNFNCPGQISVSGLASSMDGFTERVKEAGGRAVPLSVSGAFHSPFMKSASEEFFEKLSGFNTSIPALPVYSNLTAKPYEADVKSTMCKQIVNPVLWQKTIENLIFEGYTEFIEVGVGKTLCGLIKKINKDVNVYSVENEETLVETLAVLSERGVI